MESGHPPPAPQITLIDSSHTWGLAGLREISRYRDLFLFLTWRDIAIRYKQTVLGVLWAVLQPVLSMVVFTVFFGGFAGLKRETGGIPYPIFVYAGLLPWMLFAQSVGRSSESVVSSANLISKVYFPRLIIPLAATAACVVDFAVAFLVLIGMMIFYGTPLTPGILLLPGFVMLTLLAAVGVGTLVSALNVAYRDFRYIVPFMLQIWMFATPVIYPSTIVPEKWRWVVALNPVAGAVEGCRASLLTGQFDATAIQLSCVISVATFAFGLYYFRRVEDRFADII